MNTKYYLQKLLNADDSPELIGQDEYINGDNIRLGTTDNGFATQFENIMSTILKFSSLAAGTNTNIGSVEDEARKRIFFFNHNSNGEHGIHVYETLTGNHYSVLINGNVTGGLGFSKYNLIHGFVIGDLLFFTDGVYLRRINTEAGIKLNDGTYTTTVAAYTSPVAQSVIEWIRRQPGQPPTALKITQTSPALVVNFIKDSAFQFQIQYEGRDYEQTTLSAFSKLANRNIAADTYNAIDVSIPFSETIAQDVQRINLLVREGNLGKTRVIKTWDKAVTSEATEITNHNAATTALTYRFFNDQVGIVIDDNLANKPFDSVPIKAKTVEVADNRAFLGNITEGYTSPITTSLTATAVVDTEGGTLTGMIWRLIYNGGGTTKYVLYIGGVATPGYYRSISNDGITPPNPTAWADLSFISASETDVFRYYVPTWPTTPITSFTYMGSNVSVTGGPSPITLIGKASFKSDASYQIGIEFLDFSGRKTGVITSSTLKIRTPDRTYGGVSYTTGINWLLSNTAALTEIPDWAYYYSIVINKSLRTRFFTQLRADDMTYATKDPLTGVYSLATGAYAPTLAGVGISVKSLTSYGMGYTFAEGDIVKVYMGSSVYSLAVKAQVGDWIVADLVDLGALSSASAVLYEIYTPYKPSVSEPFYETGTIYTVTNPGSGTRAYSTLSGTITGDITLVQRTKSASNYTVEAMNPNDKFWQIWDTDAGRINVVDTIGQKVKTNSGRFSNKYLPGTKVNGLSTFDALDQFDVPLENGVIQKLKLTSKVQEDGTVMLCICANETCSIYLGQTQLMDEEGNAFVAKATGVIGTINTLKGSFGTQNPESVIEYRGQVFWFDGASNSFVRYGGNGLFPISDFKFKRPAKLFSQKFQTLSVAEVETLGSRPFIFGGVDPYHEEILFTIPSTASAHPKGTLTDYTGPRNYPYDIYDGQGKTIVYKISAERWAGSHTYQAEGFVNVGENLFSFKGGYLYKHNDPTTFDTFLGSQYITYNKFYGTQYKSRMMLVARGEDVSAIKELLGMGIESNLCPTFVHFRTETPNIQSSDLQNTDFATKDGIFYASILRDRLSPNTAGDANLRGVFGDRMRGPWCYVMLEWTGSTKLTFKFLNISHKVSAGHKLIKA